MYNLTLALIYASTCYKEKAYYYIYDCLLLYGKIRERAVCGEFCVLIGYPSGQDAAILPARDCPFRSRK